MHKRLSELLSAVPTYTLYKTNIIGMSSGKRGKGVPGLLSLKTCVLCLLFALWTLSKAPATLLCRHGDVLYKRNGEKCARVNQNNYTLLYLGDHLWERRLNLLYRTLWWLFNFPPWLWIINIDIDCNLGLLRCLEENSHTVTANKTLLLTYFPSFHRYLCCALHRIYRNKFYYLLLDNFFENSL